MSSLRCLAFAAFIAFANHVSAQKPFTLTGDFWFTHDPSIAKQGSTWYVFATGKAADGGQLAVRCSTELTDWHLCGHVFNEIPQWIQTASPGTKDLWAPDVSYVRGEYRLYYAYSLFGKNTSGVGLVTNKTLDSHSPDYEWVDKGLVLKSIESDNYNAIDPNFIVDKQGRSWLTFGSFWGGIKLRRLNEAGMVSTEDTKLYSLAARVHQPGDAPAKPGLPANWQAIEAPFLIRHGHYYYLFASVDMCCRGANSTYRTVVGRAPNITGPYVDQDGKPMLEGGGTELLRGNSSWAGPGGESALTSGSPELLVFHAYDTATGKPALQISTLSWSDGWPQVALGTSHGPAPLGKK